MNVCIRLDSEFYDYICKLDSRKQKHLSSAVRAAEVEGPLMKNVSLKQ